ncbi:hypothetical protein Belba_0742 [Belliella baltica DSM 15883]|uniref:LTD domain-containing protein n=1 Tax=Belliella baltica (strain DSM 15883 / CIP 108006 / LMG 21964 / BA134) TaxID=866536 RepID=I3Z2C7_BELBD|nr:lamin tail domain-containing protein [Belliella baltica]AFL83395.1 hypothetical protein Belba_0742 [Belliella baltica DSM 15883]
MRILYFVWGFLAFSLLRFGFFETAQTLAQVQDFESNFEIVNHPDEFLPFWSANEVRSTSARIFQINQEGRSNSRALAVQPISTFDGVIYTQVNLSDIVDPKIAFFAKTIQNGAGNRSALVFISFSNDQIQYSSPIQVGEDETFSNENSEFKLYELEIPESYTELVYLKIEVKYGSGSGSAARFVMDDFGVFPGAEQVDPIRIDQVLILNPYELQIQFDRAVRSFELSQVNLDGLQIENIIHIEEKLVNIQTIDPFPKGRIMLLLEDIWSEQGDLTEQIDFEIDNEKIQLGQILVENPKQMRLSFSQPYLEADVSQTSKFTINGKSPLEIRIDENVFSIHLELNDELVVDQEVHVEVNSIRNLDLENGEPQRRNFLYTDEIEAVFAVNTNQINISSSVNLDFSSFEGQDFSVLDSDFVFSEIENSDDQKSFLLNSTTDFEENVVYTLSIPPRKSSNGKLLNGSFRDFVWDATPPEIVRVVGIREDELLVIFSEPIDPVFGLISNNYSIADQFPTSVIVQENSSSILLKWDLDFQDQIEYSLEVSGIPDLAGNFMESISFQFTFEAAKSLSFKNLIINEIMPAPRAGNSLPNVEYVELFNPSDNPIALGGFQLANSRRTTTLPNEVILPLEYVILCPRTQISQFTNYGRVMGLTNWPTLLNAADQIKLFDDGGFVIDSLNYTTASFGGSSFASGGYSLEVVNPFITCNLSGNVKTAIAAERGTPGKINSVFDETPDMTNPVLLSAKMIHSNQVLLEFSKSLSLNFDNISWEINPNLVIQSVGIGNNQESLIVTFESIIQEGLQYLIRVTGLRDCVGNLIQDGENETYFTIPSPAESGDVIINEVLFNANTGGPKFVEVYNHSDKFINLKDWKLANLSSEGEIANRRIVANNDLIIAPKSFFVFTTDGNRLLSEYPKGNSNNFVELSSLPSYPQAAGNVVWLDPEEELVDIFSYTEKMHHRLLKEVRGVSLERLSPTEPTQNPENWKSASASVGFASPGLKNSNLFEGSEEFGIEINPKVFVPDAPGEQNFTTLTYKMDQAGSLATIRIYSVSGHLIRELCQNDIWGTSGFYTWDGTDSSNIKVRSGYYIITIDIFDMQGNVSQIKKTVVVGTKF